MAYQLTTATKRIARLRKRLRFVQGGTSASKTVSILLYLIDRAQSDERPTLTSIVSESFPHLKRGVIRDFISIMEAHGYFRPDAWNKTDFVYTFETGSRIEFFSADQPGKVRGPRRDRLFINEANNVSQEAFDQLEVRTKEFVFLDWNPVTEFWAYEVMPQRNDVDHIILTYLDNEGLDPAIVASIEQRRLNKSWWKVYGEGQLGEVEGRIYTGWEIIDELPHTARLERRWLDFGYSVDPSCIGGIYYHDGGYIVDEELYQKGMLNKALADFIHNMPQPQTTVVADSAEPKSIDEIKLHGVNIIPCEKGPDSVRNGIALVQDQKIRITKRSVNIIKEYRNYLWAVDKDGKRLLEEDPMCANHAMSGIRYGLTSLLKKPNIIIPAQSKPLDPYYGDSDIAY